MAAPANSTLVQNPPLWFRVEEYTAANRLDFEGWRTQVGNRIFLAGLLSAHMHDQFDRHFADIQTSPFMDLDFADNYPSGKAVFPLTFGVADTIVATLTPLSPKRQDSCDKKLLEDRQDSFGMHKHLTVDLNASESEILNDFKKVLSAALSENRRRFPRQREPGITVAALKSWREYQVLPYQDLLLWQLRQGQSMPSDTVLAQWIFSEQHGDKDTVRDTRGKATSIFSLRMLRQLSLAANRSTF